MSGHTPLPWYALGKSILLDRPGLAMLDTIARCVSTRARRKAEAEANARFIVLACNAHEELLGALKALVPDEFGTVGLERDDPRTLAARAAIAKAEGR